MPLPTEFMFLKRQREAMRARRTHRHGPAGSAVAPQGMRYAKPGERPPSKFAPGQSDQVIERFDAWSEQYARGKVRKG